MLNNITMNISIVVPVYNVEEYIEDCFSSIISQSMTDDVECIFVDDCGTDNSVSILSRLIKGYSGAIQMKVLHHEKNRGLSAARNTGMDSAQGEYIFFLDSDDSITPNCLETLWSKVLKFPKVDVVQSSTKSATQQLVFDLSDKSKKLPEYSNNIKWIRKTMLMHRKLPVTSWNRLIRKDFLQENHIRFPEGYNHEDEFFMFRMQKKIESLAINNGFTYIYRVNPNGITSSFKEKDAEAYGVLLNEIYDNLSQDSCGLYELYMMVHCANLCRKSNVAFSKTKLCNNKLFITICDYARLKGKYSYFSLKGLYYKLMYRLLLHVEFVKLK